MKRRDKLLRRKAAQDLVNSVKATHPCPCGESDIRCLDFDHIRGEKDRNISRMVRDGYSLESIKREIEKCVVLCANCHRKKGNK